MRYAIVCVVAVSAVLAAVEGQMGSLKEPHDLAGIIDQGFARIEAGDPMGAALYLRDALRAVPNDVKWVDDTFAVLQLLSFDMAALLPSAQLETFRAELDSATYPTDALAIAFYLRDLRDYANLRGLAVEEKDAQRERLWALVEVDAGLHGAAALAALATGWSDLTPAEIEETVVVLNRLADLCPEAAVTREALRETVRVCGGLGFSEPQSAVVLADLPVWNENVKKFMTEDKVVLLARAAAAAKDRASRGPGEEPTVPDVVLRSAELELDPGVRDWCLRATATTNSLSNGALGTERANAIRQVHSRVARQSNPDIATTRAQFILLANSIEAHDPDLAQELLPALEASRKTRGALDVNFYERVPRKLGLYGYELVRHGRIEEAVGIFEYLAALYPNSMLGQEWADAAGFLRKTAD